ncbi:peptide-methionine (S)-S-oxide reductase MsrA [Paraburkholderia sp. SEWSISQ10-3 4]|jgi:peptide-methionine (S)-S-oxide reductase|uniref:peptide-methionine (S)-S-oxide reductase MsrA n=1 Tax=Paraburkholderia TaxID=1822464 RepID=UPI002252211F|nr:MULTISPECIES: peptide-methionine (S)-S-oxide reductase MsrA [Paraburkholderia]MCX4137022.1 peptide-methionine (S)-S-oxide reductase MsrA [Paraburkholderia aspalathi]MDN7169714.1 peptide-methionine (S)-S-oxide reductase MsrA [Paraburkholderia sp. SEWSISQ10-3 4]MDQ6499353.1 peptide-methionine (S)-S-oxide reductase MsrA [Paraburkholderia aspalathi]
MQTTSTSKVSQRRRSSFFRLAGCVAIAAGVFAAQRIANSAEAMTKIPPPAHDESVGAVHSETAVFAGGCFWGVQGVFEHVRGVKQVASGYTGGAAGTAQYETVSEGDTGHAESVQVTYDPKQITYGRLLQIFFSVAHDPTELNYQGPDHGTQYRSAIFPANPEQRSVAQSYIAQLDKAHVFSGPIVTRVEDFKGFYPAESYHQNFLALHPDYPYIVINDLPKVSGLKRMFPDLYRNDPVLLKVSG